jgi:tRNA dimethylallyltransferase
VSADAIQVYRGLEVISGAAPCGTLETRLISFLPVGETFSAGAYADLAHAEIDSLRADGVTPIVVGGTGLYLRAALTNLNLGPAADPALRAQLLAEYDLQGAEALHARLASHDPAAAVKIAPTDRQRVVRALEHAAAGHTPATGELWTAKTRVPARLVGLTMERDALVDRIDARVDAMVAAGAADEVRRADAAGASPTARKALGFEELLEGDVGAMKVRTRRYAKRQMTWMRKLQGIELIDVTGRTAADVAAGIVP